jgi:ABC-type sugar transport system permease subunit
VKFLNYSGVVKFTTHLPLQIAKDNIRRIINASNNTDSNSILGKSHLGGSIELNGLILYRVRLLSGNYLYRPIFYGKFIERDGKVTLEGVFSMSSFIKIVFAVSGGALVLLESLLVGAAITSDSPLPPKILFLLFLPVVAALVFLVHLVFKRLFRNDVRWISKAIETALQS